MDKDECPDPRVYIEERLADVYARHGLLPQPCKVRNIKDGFWWGPISLVEGEMVARQRARKSHYLFPLLLSEAATVFLVAMVFTGIQLSQLPLLLFGGFGLLVVMVVLVNILKGCKTAVIATQGDLAFMMEFENKDACLMQPEVWEHGVQTGVDRGMAWMEGGALFFVGYRSSFVIQGGDISRSAWMPRSIVVELSDGPLELRMKPVWHRKRDIKQLREFAARLHRLPQEPTGPGERTQLPPMRSRER